jgi:hypothetical protein
MQNAEDIPCWEAESPRVEQAICAFSIIGPCSTMDSTAPQDTKAQPSIPALLFCWVLLEGLKLIHLFAGFWPFHLNCKVWPPRISRILLGLAKSAHLFTYLHNLSFCPFCNVRELAAFSPPTFDKTECRMHSALHRPRVEQSTAALSFLLDIVHWRAHLFWCPSYFAEMNRPHQHKSCCGVGIWKFTLNADQNGRPKWRNFMSIH